MARVLVAALVAMIIAILSGPTFIRFLRKHEFGQHIREEGLQHHAAKQGTPTAGGLLILLAATIAFLPLSDYTLPALTIFGTALACGGIGFLDDYIKLRHQRSLGLRGRWKMLLLLGVTVAVGFAAHHQQLVTIVFVPVVDKSLPLGPFWYVLLFLIIAGAVNGVNLTDGVDGLAAGTGIIALATFTAMAVTIFIRSATATHGRIENRLDARLHRRGADRRLRRVPLVQRVPGRGVHGRHGGDGDRRRDRGDGDHAQGRAAAALRRRDLRARRALRDPAGAVVQVLGETHLPDRADPTPLRDEGVERDEDHGALLDHHRDPLRGRVRALLQVLPPQFQPQ